MLANNTQVEQTCSTPPPKRNHRKVQEGPPSAGHQTYRAAVPISWTPAMDYHKHRQTWILTTGGTDGLLQLM
jgi:hypothetical protein